MTESPAPPSRQRQRVVSNPVPTVVQTTQSPRTRLPTREQEPKQTLGQSLSGIFDPESLTVFGDNNIIPQRVRDEPRLISQEIPRQEFQIPQVSKIRNLPDPKVVKNPRPITNTNLREEPVQEFVPQKQIIRNQEFVTPEFQTPPIRVQQPVEQPKPFISFPAQPEPIKQTSPVQPNPSISQPKPIKFQSLPAIPQQPSFTQEPNPSLTSQQSSFVQLSSSQQTRQQPEIRQPQPIPFQSRPAAPQRVSPQRAPVPPQRAPVPSPRVPALPQRSPALANSQPQEADLFEGRPSLFSQPIEIPTNSGGASFSYEAILG